MDCQCVIVFAVVIFPSFLNAQLPELDQCPPEDPNCHPWCIEYVNKCRVCRCNSEKGFDKQRTGGTSESGSGSDTDYWNGEFGSSGGDSWSSLREKLGSNGGDGWGSNGNGGKTNIIIIEKEKKPESNMMSFPGSSFAGKSPFQFSGLGPAMMNFPPRQHSIPAGCKTKNVPLVSPGVPRYCVTGIIIDCPHGCVVTDEFGCNTCPCAPATKAWMPVCENSPAPRPHPKPQNSCVGTKLCITSCKGEVKIGETGPDGCQRCTCMKKESNVVSMATTTTPKPTTKNVMECTKLIACMIKCKDTGYVIGDTQIDGCPSCQCKQKSSNNINNNNNDGGGGMQSWSGGSSGNGMTSGMNTASGNGILNNVSGGSGSGGSKCQFPLCIDGGSGSGGGNPMMPSAGSGSSGSSSGGCAGPFCASMMGGGGGGMGGGSGGGMMMGGGGGGGSSGSGGPFQSSLSSAAAASGGMGSAMKSPFMAAAGASTGGGGAGGNPMHGPMLSMGAGAGKPTEKDVHGLIGSCMDMEKCIANCGGSYVIGPLGPDGCQSCTCNPE
ncbi:uncharacterized protein LOC125661619 isoform X3 [Ostrea edulis]|uniref:uncharacterized protein LOC125661619 isoform X3 n=1 Tax=Ostrea edulis TaxID=37623 RepID=UPI0024AEC308|nr:uncharacterized protein LOC125661619 isoform X3 [Ostrea edulis]